METFVVRIFVPATPEPFPLCGLVERVGAAGPRTFRDADELIATLRAVASPADPQARTTDQEEEA